MEFTKEMTQSLLKERARLKMEQTKIEKALKALQDLCEHEWISDSYDSHKKYYVCGVCEKTESR